MSATFTPKKGSLAPCLSNTRLVDSLPFALSAAITSLSFMRNTKAQRHPRDNVRVSARPGSAAPGPGEQQLGGDLLVGGLANRRHIVNSQLEGAPAGFQKWKSDGQNPEIVL